MPSKGDCAAAAQAYI